MEWTHLLASVVGIVVAGVGGFMIGLRGGRRVAQENTQCPWCGRAYAMWDECHRCNH